MPNDIANNMVDTIHFLEEDNASMMKSLTDLQLAYNEQMIELREAKRLLRLAVEDFANIGEVNAAPTPMIHPKYGEYLKAINFRTHKWRYADESEKLLGERI